MLRALAGPFPATRFCPTGGVNAGNVATWLAEPNVVAAGGSWLCPASDIKSGNWEIITGRCIDAMRTLRKK
jgi:2-dehydro-3-deoxyphosphogluconate aldolase/(4S)-4-hydroxy-2-oxoglutarate aldolase